MLVGWGQGYGSGYDEFTIPSVFLKYLMPNFFYSFVHSVFCIEPLKAQNKVSKILLMTYMRSGSSFVGELMKFGGNVFYVYEPFWSVYEKTFRTDTEVCHRNGTCQLVRLLCKTLQRLRKQYNILAYWKTTFIRDNLFSR